MPRNGTGTYNPPSSTWNPGVNGVTATTADFNALLTDVAAGVSQSVSSDGQTPMTGNLPMGNNKITGLALGTANTDAASLANLQAAVGQAGPAVFRNRVRNPNFAVNQRAVSGSVVLAAGVYGHDGWKAGAAGCTYTFATSGIDTVLTITAGSLIQTIEGIYIEGGNYVMSWAGTAQGKIGAGSFAATGVTAAGVTANANLNIEFNTGTLGQVQLEPGTVATPFERKGYLNELTWCKRYLPVFSASAIGQPAATGQCTTTTTALITFPFDVETRVAPTGALATAAAYLLTASGGATGNLTNFVYATASVRVGVCTASLAAASLVAGNATLLSVNAAPARFIFTGAEL